MKLTPAQSQIAKDTHRFRTLNCGRRFGKTVLSIEEMIGKAVANNGRRIAYIAPTYQQARDIAWEQLKKRLEPIALRTNESRLEIEVHTQDKGTSTIILRGWEAVETLRGQAFDMLVIDEIAMMRNFWVNWNEVLRPTLADRKGDGLFISTPKGFNHFYDLYNKEAEDEDYKSFHFTTYDNPHIPPEEIDKAKKEIPEDQFAQEYLADFRKQEGLVYKEFNRDKHIYGNEVTPNILEKIAGVDFGYTNPAAVVFIGIDSDNHYWIYDEWYKREQTEEKIADFVLSQDFNLVYPDPASPSAIEVMERKGVNIREVSKGKDSVQSGIQRIRELFKQGRIHIHNSCQNLIAELETYRYKEKTRENMNEPEVPEKENDHAVDALRYALMTHAQSVVSLPTEDFALYSSQDWS